MSCLFWEPLRPCGGAGGAQSAHKAGAFGPGFGLAGGGLRPPAAKRRRPPGASRISQPSGPAYRHGRGGAAYPRPEPLGLPGTLATSRCRSGAALPPGLWEPLRPCGGAAGAQSAHKAGAFGPGFGLAGRGAEGPRPPNAAAPPQGVLPPTKAQTNEKGLGTEAFVAFTNAPNSSAVRGNRGLGSLCS